MDLNFHDQVFSPLRHHVRQLPKRLLRPDQRHVHDQPDQRGPAAPGAGVRHPDGGQHGERQGLHPQGGCRVRAPTESNLEK